MTNQQKKLLEALDDGILSFLGAHVDNHHVISVNNVERISAGVLAHKAIQDLLAERRKTNNGR